MSISTPNTIKIKALLKLDSHCSGIISPYKHELKLISAVMAVLSKAVRDLHLGMFLNLSAAHRNSARTGMNKSMELKTNTRGRSEVFDGTASRM
jgi:hypothetical protein